MTTAETAARAVTDDQGRTWHAVATEMVGAHLRPGARLSFRPADAEEPEAEVVHTPVGFNSTEAAAFAIRTMSDKELRRRLEWAKTDAGLA
ncbi:MAG TPA: hypothetical protein VFX98_14535 [Longimicrobiaceae bacterium]|nr:hypothetical protein [Longimicrobiaceae bacterium]